MSYVTLEPANFLKLILEIMMTLNYRGITNLEEIYQKVDDIFGAFSILYFIILFINVCVIDHRRKVKVNRKIRQIQLNELNYRHFCQQFNF